MKTSDCFLQAGSLFLLVLQISHAQTTSSSSTISAFAASPRSIEYTRLIPSNPQLPPVRADSREITKTKNAVALINKAGPIFNQTMVRWEYEKRLNSEFERGLAEATRLGQEGFLIQSFVVTQPVEGADFKSLKNGGAQLIGVGPSIEGVCQAFRCDLGTSFLREPRPTGTQQFDPSYGYTWVSIKGDGKVEVVRYGKQYVEQHAHNTALNADLRIALLEATQLQAVGDYADAVARQFKSEEDKKVINEMIQNRNKAIEAIKANETQYEKEMTRALKAAQVSRSLNMLVGVFEFAGVAKMAYDTYGTDAGDLTKQGIQPATTVDELKGQFKKILDDSSAEIGKIRREQNRLRGNLKRLKDEVIKEGKKHNMDPNDSPVFYNPSLG
jgi:hypothetical protein